MLGNMLRQLLQSRNQCFHQKIFGDDEGRAANRNDN